MEDQAKLKQEVLQFLQRNFIMNIAVAKDNKPSASVVLYYVDEEFNFYFATHTDSYKSKTLRTNHQISFSVWQLNEMLVQVDGIATSIDYEDEKLKIIDKLAESAEQDTKFWLPLVSIHGHDYTVFKVNPYWIRKMDLKNDTITQVDSPFVEVKLD